jgi:ribosome recycling factor
MVSDTLWNIEEKMKKSEEALKRELTTIRSGRATPALIEHLKVEYMDTTLSLNQLASISTPEARLLVVQPWDKNSIQYIEKAIQKSDLGLNPTNDGSVIRLNLPPLTEERRRELIKVVRKRIEESKVSIRNLRREAMTELEILEKSKNISQDEQKRAQEQLQKLTDSFVTGLERIGHGKEAELMEI